MCGGPPSPLVSCCVDFPTGKKRRGSFISAKKNSSITKTEPPQCQVDCIRMFDKDFAPWPRVVKTASDERNPIRRSGISRSSTFCFPETGDRRKTFIFTSCVPLERKPKWRAASRRGLMKAKVKVFDKNGALQRRFSQLETFSFWGGGPLFF